MSEGYRLKPEERERIAQMTEEDFRRLPAPRWKRASNGTWAVRIVCPDGLIRTLVSGRARGTWPVRNRQSVSPGVRFAVFARDEFRCHYCGRDADETKLHVDHLVPVSVGGTDDLSNLVTSCQDCNLGKGNRWTAED